MRIERILPLDGTTYGMTDGHVYIKKHGTFDPFVWGGDCMRIGEGSVDLGTPTITNKLDVAGGIKRDAIREGAPGPSTFDLSMKRKQGNQFKTEYRNCWWVVDQRMHCGGMDRDAWDKWDEITRYCPSKATTRTMTGIDWETPDGEAMVTFPSLALETVDLYRMTGEAGVLVPALAAHILDIDTCRAAACPGKCTTYDDCVVAAGTSLVALGSPYLLTNVLGGDLDTASTTNWTQIALTEWTTGDADAVLCLGDFIVIVSTTETAILRSDDMGVTRVEIDETNVPEWTAQAPTQIDGIDQNYILMCGLGGYMYRSVDGARTWETVSPGTATTEALTRVMIARDNPQVAYAIGTNNALIKTENGADNFFPLTGPSAADSLLGLWVKGENHLIIINDDSEIWESIDGAESWVQQESPAEVAATATNADIVGCGCDELMMSISDGTNNLIYRSVYGGASGYWYNRLDNQWAGNASGFTIDNPLALACCGPNRYIAVGGTTTVNMVYLLTA